MVSCIFTVTYSVNNFNFKLSVSDVSKLKVHEKIISSLLSKIEKSLIDNKVLFDPIIADCRLSLVIDGVHRLVALENLGIDLVPVVDVNYLSDDVRLCRWFRILKRLNLDPLKDFNVLTSDLSYDEFLTALNTSQACIGVFDNGKAYLVEDKLDAFQISRLLERFNEDVVKFTPENLINTRDIVLGYREITKEEVMTCIKMGSRFTYKFTRHIIPIRVLSLNVPLSLLTYDKLDRLKQFLNKLDFYYLGSNLVIDDRLYEENIIMRRL